jgi:hypothetical protein
MMNFRSKATTAPALPVRTKVRVRFGTDEHEATVLEHTQGQLARLAVHIPGVETPLVTAYRAEDLIPA